MIKRITEFLNLLISIVKARWILLLGFSAIFSLFIWLRNKLFIVVEMRLPVIGIVVIVALCAYPIAKFIEWQIVRNRRLPVHFRGLVWTPSRLRFRYPKPLCPHCKCEIVYRVERKSMHIVQSIRDFDKVQNNLVRHIFECPNHGVLQIPNEPMRYLQELARTKINSE